MTTEQDFHNALDGRFGDAHTRLVARRTELLSNVPVNHVAGRMSGQRGVAR